MNREKVVNPMRRLRSWVASHGFAAYERGDHVLVALYQDGKRDKIKINSMDEAERLINGEWYDQR